MKGKPLSQLHFIVTLEAFALTTHMETKMQTKEDVLSSAVYYPPSKLESYAKYKSINKQIKKISTSLISKVMGRGRVPCFQPSPFSFQSSNAARLCLALG